MSYLDDSNWGDEDQNTMGALSSVSEGERGALDGNAGSGLDVNGAVRRLTEDSWQIPGVSNIDEYVKRARGFQEYVAGMGQHAEKQEQDALANLRKENPSQVPAWLAFASGMFAPTRYGKFAENLSIGLGNAAPFVQGHSRERGAHALALAQLQTGAANRGYNRELQGVQFQSGVEDTLRKRMFAEAFLRKIQAGQRQQGSPASSSLPSSSAQSFPVQGNNSPQGRPLSPGVGPSDFAPSDTLPAWYRGWQGQPRGYQAGGLAQRDGISELPGGGWSREGENEIGVSLPEALGYSLGSEQNFLPWFNAGRPEIIEIKQGRNTLMIDKKTGRLMGVVPQELSPEGLDHAQEWRTKLPPELAISGGKNLMEQARIFDETGRRPQAFGMPNVTIPPIPGYEPQRQAQGPQDARSSSDVFARDAQGAPVAKPVAEPRPIQQRAPAASRVMPDEGGSPHPEVGAGIRPPTIDEKLTSPKQRRDMAEKRLVAEPQMRQAIEGSERQLELLKQQVEDAKKVMNRIGPIPTTKAIGELAKHVPGTDAYDLQNAVDTIKATIGFEKLNQMRQASKSGGALGSVTERETDFLQKTLGSLHIGLGKKKLSENLDRAYEQLQRAHAGNEEDYKKAFPELYKKIERKRQFEVLPRKQ